jgi:hypothetical protein
MIGGIKIRVPAFFRSVVRPEEADPVRDVQRRRPGQLAPVDRQAADPVTRFGFGEVERADPADADPAEPRSEPALPAADDPDLPCLCLLRACRRADIS